MPSYLVGPSFRHSVPEVHRVAVAEGRYSLYHLDVYRCKKAAVGQEIQVIFEESPINYAAIVPELPGCVCVGDSIEEVRRQIRKAMEVHPKGLSWAGDVIPTPDSWGEIVEVALPAPAESV